MSTYHEKKKHIYAYRRRKKAQKYINELDRIIEDFSVKDAKKFLNPLNELFWKIYEKLGWLDNIPKRGERWETPLDKKMKMGLIKDVNPIARYICPVCGKPGYLFSPNLDLEGREFDRYILHIEWPEKKTKFCHVSKVKTHLIMISVVPVEGILTMH